MTNEYMSRKQVAEMLGFGQKTIDNWLREGKFEAIKVGKRGVRIKRSSVEDLINNNKFYVAPKIKEEPIKEEPMKEIPKVHDVVFENASEDDTDMY